MRTRFVTLLLVSFLVWSLGCGSSGGDAAGGGGLNPGNGAIAVTGVAAKGDVTGTITAFSIDRETGAKLAQVAQVQTAAGGAFALSFDGVEGPVLLEATGTHRDEVSGQDLPIPADRPLVALFNAVLGDNSVSLSGLTSIHAAAALADATSADVGVAQAVANTAIALQDFYGIGDLFAEPRIGNAPDDGTKLLVLNGGFSQLGADLGVDPLAVLEALARDFAGDQTFDGRDRNEAVFADGQPLVAEAGTTALVDAAQRASGQLAGNGVIQDALDALTGLFSGDRQPRRRPSITSVSGNCGPFSGGTLFRIFGNFDGEVFDVSIGGQSVPAGDVENIRETDGTLIGLLVRVPAATGPGLASVLVSNSDDGQAALVPGGFLYKDSGEGAPSVDRSKGPSLVSKAGGTPVRIQGENLENADFVPTGEDAVDPDFQSGKRAQVPFPGQDVGGSTLQNVDVSNGEGSDFFEGIYADEPESQAAFRQKLAVLEGTWCFFLVLRFEGNELQQRFEFEFNDDGTGTRREVFGDGSFGTSTDIEVEDGPGEKLNVPLPFLGERPFEGSVANDGKLFLGAGEGTLLLGLRKPRNFLAENVKKNYNAFAGVETGETGNRTMSVFNGSFNFSEDRSTASASFQRTLTGSGLEQIVPAASGTANVDVNDTGGANFSVPGMEDLEYKVQFSEDGDCFIGWFCNEDLLCFFRGLVLGFAKAEALENSDLAGNWAGPCAFWSTGNGLSAGNGYGVGTLNEDEGLGGTVTLSEFGEKIDDVGGSPPLATRSQAESRELSLSACGLIQRRNRVGVGGTYGMVKDGGDMAFEVLPGGTGTAILFGNNQEPFSISIRTRIPEFQSVHTFTGDMNEIELSIDNGVGPDGSDLTLRTRTVRQRTLSTAVRRLRTMGFFSETIDPVVKTVRRFDSGVPTVTAGPETDNFEEVYTVVGDHMFVFPVAGQPGQNIEGLPAFIAQGRIAANGQFAVLQAPHERHGILLRILAKKTTEAPDLAGMTYHLGCMAVLFDDEDDDQLRYSRGSITFGANGTFTADFVEADEDPQEFVTFFNARNLTGTFTVEEDGRITISPDGRSPLSGMVTQDGNAIFLVNADGSSTESSFCIAVKQATQVSGFQRAVLRRMPFNAEPGIGSGSLFLRGGRSDLIRDGDDVRVQTFDHVSDNGNATGRSERFFFDATSVLEADGVFELTIGFQEFGGALSEDGVIGFLMPGTDIARANGIDILVGR